MDKLVVTRYHTWSMEEVPTSSLIPQKSKSTNQLIISIPSAHNFLYFGIDDSLCPFRILQSLYGGSWCGCVMDDLLGLLRIKVKRGIDLAIRDFKSSDPYVVIRLGDQKMKTDIIEKDLNPVWNQELTLSITNPDVQVDLRVFDHDTFTRDDEMGDAGFDIKPFVDAQKMNTSNLQNGAVIKKIKPSDSNCLSEESCITWINGSIIQNVLLKLRNVECGEIELELQWIELPK